MDMVFKKKQMVIFGFCWVGYFLTYFGRLNLSVAMNAIEQEFSSGSIVIGLLGSSFFWVYAFGKLFNGYMGDFLNNKQQVFLGILISGCTNILIGFSQNIWIIICLWAVNGFAQSALWCNMIRLIANWFYEEQHAGTIIWLSTSMVGGTLAGWGICGVIIQVASWRWVFLIPGIGLVLFSLLWKHGISNTAEEGGFPELKRVVVQKKPDVNQEKSKGQFWRFIVTSYLIWIIIACLAQGVIKDGIGLWGPTMLQDLYGVSAGYASVLLLFIPIMNFLGIMLVGAVQKTGKLNDAGLVIIMMGISACLLTGLCIMNGSSMVAGVVLLGSVSAVMYGVNTILLGVFPLHFTRQNKVSFVSGLLDFCSYIAAGLSSIFSGFILEYGLGWNCIFLVWLVLAISGIVALTVVQKKGIL